MLRYFAQQSLEACAKMKNDDHDIGYLLHHPNLAKMSRIYIEVLGGKKSTTAPPQTFPSRTKNSFMFGDIWVAAMEGESLPSRTYNHIAFKTDEAGLEKAKWAALNHTKA